MEALHKLHIRNIMQEAIENVMDQPDYFIIIGNKDKVITMSEGMPSEDIITFTNKAVWEASKEWEKENG